MKPVMPCYDHRDRPSPAPACHTCSRIQIERDIVTRVVDALLGAGLALRVNDGESFRPAAATLDRAAVLAELMETDDDTLEAHALTGRAVYWVRFVYGNGGYDVVSDYHTGLETILAPVNKYADTLQ